jgi:hypothetical protein
MKRLFRWLWRFLVRGRAVPRPARQPPPRRLGFEGLEDRRLFSATAAPLLRLGGPAQVAVLQARLDALDTRTAETGGLADTIWQEITLPSGRGGAAPGRLLAVVGDFNGDGLLDLVVHSRAAGHPAAGQQDLVSLLLGTADGTFQAAPDSLPDPGVIWSTAVSATREGKLPAGGILHSGAPAAIGARGNGTAATVPPGVLAALADDIPANPAAPGDEPGASPDPAGDQPGGAGENSDQGTQGTTPAAPPVGPGVWEEPPRTGVAPENGALFSPRLGDGGRGEVLPAETPAPPVVSTAPAVVHIADGSEQPARGVSGGAVAGDGARPPAPTPVSTPDPGPGQATSGLLPVPGAGLDPVEAGPLGRLLAGTAVKLLPAARGRAGVVGATARPGDATPAEGQRWAVADLGQLLAQAFYLSKLKQAGASPDPHRAGALLQSPSDTRLLVADLIQRSTEALTRLVQGFYVYFLGRAAAAEEEAGWVGMLLNGQTEEQVLSAFLSTAEFYTRAGTLVPAGTGDERFIRTLYELLLQRPASDAEVAGWLGALPGLGRGGVASALLASQDYRSRRIEGYYQEFVGRPAGATEVASWAGSPFDLLTIRLFFESHSDVLATP